jgi:hypothetical protein
MVVLVDGTPTRVKAVKVCVIAAVPELSVHCVTGKDSAITASASYSGSNSFRETGVGIAAAHAALDDAPCPGGHIMASGGSPGKKKVLQSLNVCFKGQLIILLLLADACLATPSYLYAQD